MIKITYIAIVIVFGLAVAFSPAVSHAGEEDKQDVGSKAASEETGAEVKKPKENDQKDHGGEDNGSYDAFIDKDGDRVDDRWEGFQEKKRDEKEENKGVKKENQRPEERKPRRDEQPRKSGMKRPASGPRSKGR